MGKRVNSNVYLSLLRYYPLRYDCVRDSEKAMVHCFCSSELDKVCISFRYTLIWMTHSKQITKHDSFFESVPSTVLFFTEKFN